MGWIHEDKPGHEGYVVAVDRDPERAYWHEHGYFPSLACGAWRGEDGPVTTVQVACECGWRSSRYAAPSGTRFFPHTVVFAEHYEEAAEAAAVEIWREHIRTAPLMCGDDRAHLMLGTRRPGP